MAKKMKTVPKALEVIHRRRTDYLIGQGYLSLLLRGMVLASVVFVLMTNVFLITQVSGNGMYPALEDGDLILAYRLQRVYIKNDVVVYRAEGKTRMGRILGRGGDVITMDDSGSLRVNGTTQGGEILYPTYPKAGTEYPYVVPEGHVYILGDYRTQTQDSRDFGPISESALLGKVITLLRRRGI